MVGEGVTGAPVPVLVSEFPCFKLADLKSKVGFFMSGSDLWWGQHTDYIHKTQLLLIFKLFLPINTLKTSLMHIKKRPTFPLS